MKRTTKVAVALLAPALIITWAQELPVLIYAVMYSFHHFNLTKLYLGVYFNDLDNFRRMMFDPMFWHSLNITAQWVLACLTLEILLGLGIALLLYREIKGRGIFRSLIILPLVTAPTVAAYIWKIMLHPTFGVLNYFLTFFGIPMGDRLGDVSTAFGTLVLIDLWQWTPFMALVLLAGLEGLPREPFEAAKVDGASPWLVFRRITLPMLKPVLLIGIFIRIIWLFKNFDIILILTRGGPGAVTNVLGMEIYRVAFKEWSIGYGLALTWIQFLIVLAIIEILLHYLGEVFYR